MVLVCGVTGILFIQINKNQSVTAGFQYTAEEVFTMWNITKQLQIENSELKQLLNCTGNLTLLRSEYGQLELFMNATLYNLTLMSLLINEQQTSMQLEAENQKQRSILFSNHLTFLWGFCNKSTLHCSRCLPGWVEHASRCFFLSSVAEKWEVARQLCISMGGDLAIVLNAEDQAFLTNMTFQYVQAHPQEDFHSAWIGLQDMVKEGTHLWINGKTIKWDVIYWKESEPNNAVPDWDTDLSGQDCVAIVPPK
uniref:C-type lectin domain-containing protein n=1 Tax=Seriola lalandi dorsalis TaxID=1841481 RepID=A0A3B4WLQ2_SERLL